jgi:FAD/FMN-containing dehydrogenase
MATTIATTARSIDDLAGPEFRAAFRGELIAPGDSAYDEARKVYNGMIDRRPGLIARCVDVADVMAAVRLARENNLLVSVRGGGHNAGGLGVADGALCIDLSPMRGVHVDPREGTILAEGGCTWGDIDHAGYPFGLSVPCGIISTTGVGGLTLGGGIGHLARKYGLSVDNLLAVDMVLADGRAVTASEAEHSDLFWAVRGGGGNFGVVTSFLFRGAPVEAVIAGPTLWELDMAADAMRFYERFMRDAPDELTGFFAFLVVPPAEPFPEELHMKTMCGVVWCWCGSPVDADRVFAPVRDFGPPALDGLAPVTMPQLNSAFDALYTPGMQWYWKADFVDELTDEAIARHVEHGSKLPTLHSTMHLYAIDGAVNRVPADATAFRFRNSRWAEVIVGVDPDPAKAETITQLTRDYYDALHPHSAGGAYVNFLMHDEGAGRIEATYGENYDRLREVKRTYDPDNLFRVNQNIEPA